MFAQVFIDSLTSLTPTFIRSISLSTLFCLEGSPVYLTSIFPVPIRQSNLMRPRYSSTKKDSDLTERDRGSRVCCSDPAATLGINSRSLSSLIPFISESRSPF